MKFAAQLSTLFFALLALSACETVGETLIINETGTGSLLIDWTVTDQQLADIGVVDIASQPIDRAELGATIDDAFGTDGYVLSDRVAFNELRVGRTGLTITKPIRNLDDVRGLGAEDLQSGRPPVLLWREIDLIEADDGSLSLTARPSVNDRQALIEWASEPNETVSLGNSAADMVFVASFSPRGQITSHNADEVDGNTLRWRVVGATPRTLEVDWTPLAPETQSAVPFVGGLLIIIGLCAGLLYWFDKRNLDRVAAANIEADPNTG